MPEKPIELITPRQVGCEAVPNVKGTDFSLPVCMCGTTLVGCNNPYQCEGAYTNRVYSPSAVHMISRTSDGCRVRRITTVPRLPVLDGSNS